MRIKSKNSKQISRLWLIGAMAAFLSTNISCNAGKLNETTEAPKAPAWRARIAAVPPPTKGGVVRNGIRVAYPHDKSDINAPSTFIVGAIDPPATLSINGTTIPVNQQGYFAHVVPLTIGENRFTLVKNGDASQSFALSVKRPSPPAPVPADPAQIMKSSIEPKQDLGVEPGDIIQLAMRGSPGSSAQVRLGGRVIQLAPAGSKVNAGLDTAFGVSYQRSPAKINDMYSGFYRVTSGDTWQGETPVFVLTKNGVTVTESAPSRVSVLQQPLLCSTVTEDTVVRVGPGAGRTTPWPTGVRVLVDGFVGDNYRCEVAPGKHLWIDKKDLSVPEDGGMAPRANVRTINIENEGSSGARVIIPLTQRLPFELKQDINPVNRLQLKLYGATADTDWVTEPSTRADATNNAAQPVKTYPADRSHNPVSFITWQQVSDNLYQVSVNLNQRQQWGYWADYEDNNLILHINGAPNVALGPGTLQGLKVCVDPGHGGAEAGAIGCGGVKESMINLGIGLKLAAMLRAEGAEVILTRDSDVDVSLADRVAIANKAAADLLISVHNNSLPDGRNPLSEHGTSSYYYHPQSLLLSNALRAGVLSDLGFPNFHTRWQNLALCRPSRMPASLVEVGFVINPDEYAALVSDGGQSRAARGIVRGVHQFLAQALTNAPVAPKKNSASSGTKRSLKQR